MKIEWAAGRLKPGFGLSGGCSRVKDLVRRTKLVLMPWGLTRFHHSGQSHFVTFCCYHRRRLFTTDASRRIFESSLERVRCSFRLQVYGYVVMPEHVHLLLSEPQQDTLADVAEVVEARSSAAFDWRCGAFLAKEVLRFQHSKLPAVCGKAALSSSQSAEGWVVRASGGLGVEQFSPLRNRM